MKRTGLSCCFRTVLIVTTVLFATAIALIRREITFAAPVMMPDGQIFDAAYYAAANPDVVKACGTSDVDAMYWHYLQYGQKEGRAPSKFLGDKEADASMRDRLYDEEIITLTNEERREVGLEPLSRSETLMQDACVRAAELPSRFSHTRPDGTKWWTVDPDHMYGENLLWVRSAAPGTAMEKWMNSDSHRECILDPEFTVIGTGHVVVGDIYYVVQSFGY